MPGPGEVLDLIRSRSAVTRGEVLEVTGMSRSTVYDRVDALFDAGLIVETGTERARAGRPARRLTFNPGHATVVAVTVDTTHTTVALTDLSGRVFLEERLDAVVADGPDRTLAAIIAATRDVLARPRSESARVAGVAISVPGPVDPHTERPSQPPIMPGWDAYPIRDHLGDAVNAPILVANDADATALGEQRAAHPDSAALCLVKVSSGIGAGIVIGGRVYSGSDGGAGDIGHVKLADRDELCQCGARGCLAAVASGRAVAAALTVLGKPAVSGSDVATYLAAGDADAARLTQEAGREIGGVVATVVSLLNPSQVVLGGRMASAPLLAGVRETLYPRSLPRATRHLAVSLSTLGERAAIVGLATLLVEREYSADNVNAALAR